MRRLQLSLPLSAPGQSVVARAVQGGTWLQQRSKSTKPGLPSREALSQVAGAEWLQQWSRSRSGSELSSADKNVRGGLGLFQVLA
jgi:hypothetical protein